MAIFTAFFVWWQARLLRTQNELSALIQLSVAWDSEYTRRLRTRWAEGELRNYLNATERDLVCLEPILEFLEEFAGLHKRRVLNDEIIWDSTIGWHAVLYYAYNSENGNIGRLKIKWAGDTLYQNLSFLWQGYLKIETKQRGIQEGELIQQIRETKTAFIEAERYAGNLSQRLD